MRGAEALVQMLLEYKVGVVFGVPGDTSLALYEAIHDAFPKIRHIMARDERSAGFMADAYARIARKPGICECPSGAGALYSIPGVAEANASSIPVILFTSDISLADEGKGAITALDHHKLFEPVTKWSSFMKQVEKIPEDGPARLPDSHHRKTGRGAPGFTAGGPYRSISREHADHFLRA